MRNKALMALLAAAILAGPAALPFEAPLVQEAQAAGKLGSLEGALKIGSVAAGGGRGGEAALVLLLVEFFIHVAPYLLFPRQPFLYQDYPYELEDGYILPALAEPAGPGEIMPYGRVITFEARASYMVDSAELQGYRAYGKIRLSYLFNLDIDSTQFFELRDDKTYDTLTFAKVDGLFNISNSRYHDIDLGFGYSYIDGVDWFGGVNAKLTGDIFPVRPLGIHFSGAVNAFPGGALFETEFALGLFLEMVEFRVGYRALWVGELEIHGPMAGIAIWF